MPPSRRTRAAKVNYAEGDPSLVGAITTFSDEEDFNPSEGDDGDDDGDDDDVEMEDAAVSSEGEAQVMEPEMAKQELPNVLNQAASSAPAKHRPPQIQPRPPALQVRPPQPAPKRRDRISAETMGDRYREFFGNDNQELIKAIETRINWGPVAFVPEPYIAERPSEFVPENPPQSRSKSPITAMLAPRADELLVDGHNLTLDNYTLSPGTARFTDNVILLNAGNYVQDVKWSPFGDSTQILAVAILKSELDPIDACASDKSISAFGPANGESLIHFYSLDVDSQQVNIYAIVHCGNHGPVVKMQWRPVLDSSELAVLFQDGTIVLVPRPTERATFDLEIDSNISLDARITSFSWKSEDELVCGTIDGYIAEFDITNSGRPLYYHPLHLSIVYDIATSFPFSTSTICTTSPDGDTRVTDPNDFSKSIAIIRGRSFIPKVTFLPMLNAYMTQDDSLLTRMVLAHDPSYPTATQLTKHDASVSAFSASYMHPFVLSGATDGSVELVNAARRALAPRRSLKNEKSVRLWTLHCEERTKKYFMVENLQTTEYVAKAKTPQELSLSPQTCTITSLDWIQTRRYASWYCAATAGGLLRIECLS